MDAMVDLWVCWINGGGGAHTSVEYGRAVGLVSDLTLWRFLLRKDCLCGGLQFTWG